jgi:hypothetical protein
MAPEGALTILAPTRSVQQARTPGGGMEIAWRVVDRLPRGEYVLHSTRQRPDVLISHDLSLPSCMKYTVHRGWAPHRRGY